FSFLLPITFILFIRRFGLISSLSLPERRERIFPFMLISLIYLITAYIFWSLIERIYIDKRLFIIFLGIVLSLVLLSFITIFFKISAHSLAISGILGGMFAFAQKNAEESFFVPMVLTAIFWGLVLAARLSLKAHSPKEVIWGSVAGFFINFVFVSIFI
ncbi:MAG: PA-phosphatase, partial [Thermonemataceae bacterium]|nr:PA-phosphatase [Thermonemataceae bacterium]